MWHDDPYDRSRVPTRWHSPVSGDGLLTTGSNVDGDYGYCFEPQIFVKSGIGEFYTNTSYSIHGYNAEVQGEKEAPFANGWHPFFATREDAVAWLKNRKLNGEVQRYAHHKPLDQRGPVWEFEPVSREYRWVQYRPWVTAGVTDVVMQESGDVPTNLLGLAAGFELHESDNPSRHVGGNDKFLADILDACDLVGERDE